MRADIVPGGTFPDYELSDHSAASATRNGSGAFPKETPNAMFSASR